MYVLVDLTTAPEEVRQWVANQLGVAACILPPEPKPPKSKPEPKSDPEPKSEHEPPSREDVLAAGKTYLQTNGPDGLRAVLESMDLPSVSKCPEDKLVELLAKLAVE